jgi:hypothetical protein
MLTLVNVGVGLSVCPVFVTVTRLFLAGNDAYLFGPTFRRVLGA